MDYMWHISVNAATGGRLQPAVARISAACYCRCRRDLAPGGRTAMAKGQKRSNREVKKPKADKKKAPATAGVGVVAAVKAKTAAAPAGGKK
jgi:hypothetical protein